MVVPTRELADQIFNVCQKLQKLFHLKTVSACGGTFITEQIAEIQRGADIIIGTPGRLVELLLDDHIQLKNLEVLILDEADRLLSGDLQKQLDGLKEHILPECSNTVVCACSATLPLSVRDGLMEWTGEEAVLIEVAADCELVSRTITQVVHVCAEHKKLQKLKKHLTKIKEQNPAMRNPPRILIFANTIKTVRFLYNEVQDEGYKIAMLHGKRSMQERNEAMEAFR